MQINSLKSAVGEMKAQMTEMTTDEEKRLNQRKLELDEKEKKLNLEKKHLAKIQVLVKYYSRYPKHFSGSTENRESQLVARGALETRHSKVVQRAKNCNRRVACTAK